MQKKYTLQPTETVDSSSTATFRQNRKTAPRKNGIGSSPAQSCGQNWKTHIDELRAQLCAINAKLASLETKSACNASRFALLSDATEYILRQNKNRLDRIYWGLISVALSLLCVFIAILLLGL